MDKREWITVDVHCKYQDDEWVPILVDTELWDSMLPGQRYEYVCQEISSYFNEKMWFEGFQIIASMAGKFERRYSPSLIKERGEMGITLTVREMLDDEVLNFQWEAKGYATKAEMYEEDNWPEDSRSATTDAEEVQA